MKKTITFSLLLAASTCSFAAGSADLVDLAFTSNDITLNSAQTSVNVSGETKDNLISSTLPADAVAGTVLGQIEFELDTNYTNEGDITLNTQHNILSIVSSTGTAYSVSAVYTSYETVGKASYHRGHLVLNVGSQTVGDSATLSFYEGPEYNASITMVANGSTAAEGVTITLQMGDKSIGISTTEALTGSFVDMVAAGGKGGNSTVAVTAVRTHKTVAESKDDAVPEPTTATLSLLALAGLAARRRRK